MLRGQAGNLRIEVSAAGRVMRELGRVEGTAGKDIELTLDLGAAELRHAAHGRRERRRRGDRRDQRRHHRARLVAGLRPEQLRLRHQLGRVERAPRTTSTARSPTRPITGTYPPGSTFKICMALAALEAGVVSPGDGVGCGGCTYLGNRRFHCWKRGGHGRVDLRRSLAQSCDCYYYEMGRRLGPDRISADGAQARPRRPPRPADAGGLRGQHARRRLEEGEPRRELDHRRQLQLRHRPGLHPRLAAAARGDDAPASPAAPRSSRG